MNIQTRLPYVLTDLPLAIGSGSYDDTFANFAIELSKLDNSSLIEGELAFFGSDGANLWNTDVNTTLASFKDQTIVSVGSFTSNYYNAVFSFKPSEIIKVHKVKGTEGSKGTAVFDISALFGDMGTPQVGDTIEINLMPEYHDRLRQQHFEPYSVAIAYTPSSDWGTAGKVAALLKAEFERIKSKTGSGNLWYDLSVTGANSDEIIVTSKHKDISPNGLLKFYDYNDPQNFIIHKPSSRTTSVKERGTYKQLHTHQDNMKNELRLSLGDSFHNSIWESPETTIVLPFQQNTLYDRYDVVLKVSEDFIKHEETDPNTVMALSFFMPESATDTAKQFLDALVTEYA